MGWARGIGTWAAPVLAVAGSWGCGPKVSVEGQDGSETSGSASAEVTGRSSAEGGVTGRPATSRGSFETSAGEVGEVGPFPEDFGPFGVCEITPGFTCGQGIDCLLSECGDPFSPFDENGCLRRDCPCDEGEVCFRPGDWGGCVGSELMCEEIEGVCSCGGSEDCGGSYCLPVEQVPAVPCVDQEDPTACQAANCMWLEGARVLSQGGTCQCDMPTGICVEPVEYFPLAYTLSYYRLDKPDEAVTISGALEPTPYGLAECSDFGPAPACECAAMSPCG